MAVTGICGEGPQQVGGEIGGLLVCGLCKDPGQVSGRGLLLGGLCHKKLCCAPAPKEAPPLTDKGDGDGVYPWGLKLRAQALWAPLPKYQVSNELFLLPLPGLERLVKCILYITSWLDCLHF